MYITVSSFIYLGEFAQSSARMDDGRSWAIPDAADVGDVLRSAFAELAVQGRTGRNLRRYAS